MEPRVELVVKGDVEVLRPGPGDKIVVSYHTHRASAAALTAARAQLQAMFPLNEVFVISGGCVHVVAAGSDIPSRR